MRSKEWIYLTTNAEKVIGNIDEHTNLPCRINSIIVRYGSIMEYNCPSMKVNEWLAICDVMNATLRETDDPHVDPALYMWSEVADANVLEGLGDKWEIDAGALALKLRNMSYVELCAVIEVVNRFWQAHDSQQWESDSQMVEYFGAKIAK